MQIAFVGDFRYNIGPCNVNREIIRHKSNHVLHVNYTRRFGKFPDALIKILVSKVVVISGISRLNHFSIRAAKIMGKKTAYIMHGCAEFEAKLNGVTLSDADMRREREIMQYADLLLPVSKRYSQWVKRQYPQYAEKTDYWRPGVAEIHMDAESVVRQKNTISAAGGDLPLKRNMTVSNAIERLNGSVYLTVYGHAGDDVKSAGNRYTQWVGTVDHDLFLRELKGKEIFVVNSVIESFNISLVEALSCGCSILVSDKVGAAEIMCLTDQDIIYNPDDENELVEKIQYLLKNPNNRRIWEKLDWKSLGYDAAVKRLEQLCEKMAEAQG